MKTIMKVCMVFIVTLSVVACSSNNDNEKLSANEEEENVAVEKTLVIEEEKNELVEETPIVEEKEHVLVDEAPAIEEENLRVDDEENVVVEEIPVVEEDIEPIEASEDNKTNEISDSDYAKYNYIIDYLNKYPNKTEDVLFKELASYYGQSSDKLRDFMNTHMENAIKRDAQER